MLLGFIYAFNRKFSFQNVFLKLLDKLRAETKKKLKGQFFFLGIGGMGSRSGSINALSSKPSLNRYIYIHE